MPDEPRRKIESWPARSHFVGIDGLARSYDDGQARVEIIRKITRVYSPDWSKFVDIEHAVGARHLQRRSAAEKGFSTNE
jgi:hypothetical protein